jgi:hypothetical protein
MALHHHRDSQFVRAPAPLNPMKRESTTALWMGLAFAIAFGLAATVLARNGTDAKSLVKALQLTARWSFLLFWIAYAGRAMAGRLLNR